MRAFEQYLKLNGWMSEYKSVQRLLDHLQRKTKSESSRLRYCEAVYRLCVACGKNPDELVVTRKSKLESLAQGLLDKMRREDRSVRYINVTLAQLVSFFRVNGFKNGKELELNRYTQPARYRKVPEYIPTSQEIERMANYAGSPKGRALVLGAYTGGLRNSTLRAVLYGDIKAELDAGKETVHVPVYVEMKRVTPNAAKNSLPYTTFFSKDTVEAIKAYLSEFNRKNQNDPLRADEPLFQGQVRGRPIKARTLQVIVKNAARKGGIGQWKYVTPHALRKAFENAIRNSGLDYKDQLFLEGHLLPGSEDAYFDKTRVEEFRQKHANVVFLPTALSGDQVRRQAILDNLRLLSTFGVQPELTEAIRRTVEQAPPEKAQTISDRIMEYVSEAGGRPVSVKEIRAFIGPPTTGEKKESKGMKEALKKKGKLAEVSPFEYQVSAVASRQSTKRFCVECGAHLAENAKYCANCGTKV
jgi:integrase/ribosomal protein L40E